MSANKLQPVRGTHDILPAENRDRRFVTAALGAIAECYGYGEISTPVFEFSDVFHRTLGDTSDVVTKETYSFTDRGGESLTLRPEFTASAVRAFLSNGLVNELPVKWYYCGPAFRYERPQKGRLRQFHQFGVELLGVAEPLADAEVIALAQHALRGLGLAGKVKLELNSLGDAESRAAYRHALVEYLRGHESKLSEDSRTRLERNPLRVLDSKDEGDRAVVAGAPTLHDYFTPHAREFFASVCRSLNDLGIAFTHNEKLVRGLDYYSHTVFEFTTTELGAQGTVLAGGRYDGLVEMMGGQPTPGIGWAAGIERLCALVDVANHPCAPKLPPVVAVVPIGDEAEREALKLTQALRAKGVHVELGYRGNVKKRMQRADKMGAAYAIVMGEDELKAGSYVLRDLKAGEQETLSQQALFDRLAALMTHKD